MALSGTNTGVRVEEFDYRSVTEEEWEELTALRSFFQAERLPDDPPDTVSNTRALFQNLPSFIEMQLWVAREHGTGRQVAFAWTQIMHTPDNQHIVQFNIQVLPEYRRRGIARQMLWPIAEVARRTERTLLLGLTYNRVPGGAVFMERMGGNMGLETKVSQLKISEVDPALLRLWQERAQERASDFEIGEWRGPYPQEDINATVELKKAMNLAPRGNLQVEDFDWSEEHIRQYEASLATRNILRWTLYARHKPSGELAGYTEVFWNPARPTILNQEDTAVWSRYRNLGLGRWLKAAMLERVMRDLPQVQFVRTGNASSNAAMLNINYELGFKPYSTEQIWQVELSKVEEYLGNRENE